MIDERRRVGPETLRAAARLTECDRLFPKLPNGTPTVLIELLDQAAFTIEEMNAELELLTNSVNFLRSRVEESEEVEAIGSVVQSP